MNKFLNGQKVLINDPNNFVDNGNVGIIKDDGLAKYGSYTVITRKSPGSETTTAFSAEKLEAYYGAMEVSQ